MSTDAGTDPGATVDPTGAELRLVTGHLLDEELAAVAVAIAALNVASRAEAEERRLEGAEGIAADGWSDAVHRLPRMHDARNQAGEAAWAFSHR